MRRVWTVGLALVTLAVVTSTFAISTGKNVTKLENAELPRPTPSASPATTTADPEFSSRRGTAATSKKENLEDGFNPSPTIKKKLSTKNSKNNSSAAAASTKSSHVTYPEDTSARKSPSQEETGGGDREQGDDPVVLELLDEKERREASGEVGDSEGEGRGKYPRIYYGDALPPTHYTSAADEDEGAHLRKHQQELPPGDHSPKYFYPKSYVQNKRAHKGGVKNKKKFEYKYEQDTRHLEERPSYTHGEADHTAQQTPDLHYHGPDHKENADGFEEGGAQEDYGFGRGHYGGGGGPFHRRDAAEIISKALHVLIPSALLLTGLSAVFPTRIHVPTNDYGYYNNQNNNNIRGKRSIEDHTGRQINEILQPEHRSLDDEAYPAYRSYNFEIGAPRERFVGQAHPQHLVNEFSAMPTFDQDSTYKRAANQDEGHGHKTSGFISNDMNQGPQSPVEYDLYHHHGHRMRSYQNFASPDSVLAPSSIATPTVVAAPESLNSIDYSFPQKPKRKMRTRTRVKVRPGNKRKSRPLPTEPALPSLASIPDINKFQSHLIRSEQSPSGVGHIGRSRSAFIRKHENIVQDSKDKAHAPPALALARNLRLGDEYVKSMVENHETAKASAKQVDLSPDGAVMGLITSYAQHDKDSPACQKRALCELAIKGKSPTATKFETFLYSLASLVPEQFSRLYELDDIFQAVQKGSCDVFHCSSPNLDLQV